MMADRWQYLALMVACIVITLPLELGIGARVYRQPRRALIAIVPSLAAFAVWDSIAIARQDWWFASHYITGVHVGWLPVEEIAFFVAIPLCALLTFEAVQRVLARSSGNA